MLVPLIVFASSLNKKHIVFAMSVASEIPRYCLASVSFNCWEEPTKFCNSSSRFVATIPGLTEFKRIPFGANSTAKQRIAASVAVDAHDFDALRKAFDEAKAT